MDNNYSGEEFLNKLYKDMHISEVVMHTAIPSDNKEEKVSKYMERLERTHQGKHLEYLKKLYYDKYVIKEENIPQSYIDFLDKEYFDKYGYHITEDSIIEHKKNIIKDQQASIDSWLEYLTSEDAKFYPMWAKYWAFQGMLNIGSFDNQNGIYKKRSKATVAPFVELDREVLAKSIDLVIKEVNKENIDDEQLQKLIKNGNFLKLYTTLLSTKREKVLNSNDIEGVWVKYNQGNDYKKLYESLQGKNTGWCTAGEDTCRSQIAGGDFYVYYTYDEKREPTIPRLAIRMNGTTQIGEIRGIAKAQHIEPHFEEVLDKKLEEFPDREKYKKRLNDTKMITYIYTKYELGKELTEEDLRFIFEVDENIEGFGWKEDPRLTEIKQGLKGKITNKEIVLAAVQQNGKALEYASAELKSDKEVVLAAVQQNGHALEYASAELKNDKEFVLAAVQQYGCSFCYASVELKSDKEFVLAAVQQNVNALEYASEELKNDKEFVLAAVQQAGSSLYYASEELKSDKEVVLAAVQQNGHALEYASEELKNDKEFVLELKQLSQEQERKAR